MKRIVGRMKSFKKRPGMPDIVVLACEGY